MSGQTIIPLPTRRNPATDALPDAPVVMLVFVGFEAMMLAGMVGGFMLTRANAAGAWPPAGQPWFAAEEMAIHSAALLISGSLAVLSGRAQKRQDTKAGPLLLGAISLGAVFVLLQTVAWLTLVNQGLSLISTQPGAFFSLTMGLHNATALGALVFMAVAWRRLRRLPAHDELRRSLRGGTLSAARILWYFAVGTWPVLYLCLYR